MSERSPLAGIIGIVSLGVAAAIVTVVIRSGDDPVSTAPPAGTVAVAPNQSPNQPTPQPQSGPGTLPDDPEIQLNARLILDHSTVETLVGQWVPQLSAKRVGTVDRGITYTLPKILEMHQQLRTEYQALLLRSGDYVFKATDLYVSIAPQGFPTPEGALQFCRDHNRGPNDCFAKFITHDKTITDTVEQQ